MYRGDAHQTSSGILNTEYHLTFKIPPLEGLSDEK